MLRGGCLDASNSLKLTIQFEKINGDLVTWEVYQADIYKRFGPCYEDPMEEIKNLRQNGTVPDYQDQFEALHEVLNLDSTLTRKLLPSGKPASDSREKHNGRRIQRISLTGFRSSTSRSSVTRASQSRHTRILPQVTLPRGCLMLAQEGLSIFTVNTKENHSMSGNYHKDNA
ncbi:hypothetical protein Tco_0065365 [Tanacetum coccineum]